MQFIKVLEESEVHTSNDIKAYMYIYTYTDRLLQEHVAVYLHLYRHLCTLYNTVDLFTTFVDCYMNFHLLRESL